MPTFRMQRTIRGPLSGKSRRRESSVTSIVILIPLIGLLGFLLFFSFASDLSTWTLDLPDRLSMAISHTTTTSPAIAALKIAFQDRYGPSSQTILAKGIRTYGSIQPTAERMLRAAARQRPFVMAFGGYSVTVGRGNFFHQSFPFVLQRVLGDTFQQSLGIPLEVRNGAIGGIPSFPYGFCLQHFLGNDADTISWDYSMNEGIGATVLEAYIRQGLALPHHPMLILVDTNKERCDMLQRYSDLGILNDSISMAKGEVVDQALLSLPDDQQPPGLREWDQFGAPKQCPGRGSWHPKRMEHELMGWMLAMHMLAGVETAMAIMAANKNWKVKYSEDDSQVKRSFPATIHAEPANEESVTKMLFGHADENNKYTLNNISCRTSFLPAVDQNRSLSSIVVSGLRDTDLDMMEERTDDLYKDGWVLDVSDVERKTKKKVERCGGLGYIDMKIALYGIPESGPLRVWLPYEGSLQKSTSESAASVWLDGLILCEANERRNDNSCQIDKDLIITVGGIKVDSISLVDGAGVYLNRKTCVNIGIPSSAESTKLGQVKKANGEPLSLEDKKRLAGANYDDGDIGIVVDIEAGPGISRENGACCVSHIVWEQH